MADSGFATFQVISATSYQGNCAPTNECGQALSLVEQRTVSAYRRHLSQYYLLIALCTDRI